MRFYLLTFFSLVFSVSFAQKSGEISGVIVDSEKTPLSKATVTIVSKSDSVVVSYSVTTDKGAFNFVRLPVERNLSLIISHVNMPTFEKDFRLKDEEKLVLDTIVSDQVSIDEVVIQAQAPIRMNGDTLEYKADYFKTRPNATVEELLQLLPGLQVNVDGSIYYLGRQVSGVRVNNKDFFIEDLTIATRNLDASLIDIIQVIKDKGESKRE